ncbi:hypothetical protein SGR_4181 [Streptomyces griseus subsp. griseus NBRC 13350]|uniref:Uncharacterized protein n=1 Tax=Streptomyces griseus subsp. griseus (strain JCM 4626 / CBS 651.72 / NBRC 13350 / KCC S-0626 / ISP 5235) TaxID=455632 RepID=B1VTC0_STRGG|nr:hypothetical protein SGR_4181 [Streptomyces griseus subsp. griseus NBRC 13350]
MATPQAATAEAPPNHPEAAAESAAEAPTGTLPKHRPSPSPSSAEATHGPGPKLPPDLETAPQLLPRVTKLAHVCQAVPSPGV